MLPTAKLTWFQRSSAEPVGWRGKLLWTFSNALMLGGAVLLLYVGGIYANDEYGRYAARGDSDVPAQPAVAEAEPAEPAPFVAPILNRSTASSEGQLVSAPPSTTEAEHATLVTRVVIPSIQVDSKVVGVGWDVEEQGGEQVAVWEVAKFAVGQHRGSANPGEGGNIVLAGHVGGFGKVFKELYYVQPGDQITLYSGSEQYLYTVQQRLLVTEEGVSDEQHAENAQLIAPTTSEMVTLITCWPPTGTDRFTQRVVLRATPFHIALADQQTHSSWSMR